jgi:type II secretory pathway pseudopilin PulG
MRDKNTKKAQIWVETIIYTLIGLVLIGMVLAVAKPAVMKMKDQQIINSAIASLNEFDNQIDQVHIEGVSSSKKVYFNVQKGRLVIDGQNDRISFIMYDSSYAPSEFESSRIVNIQSSNLKIKTQKSAKNYNVTIWRDYPKPDINITYNGKDSEKIFNQASLPYILLVENRGRVTTSSPLNINIYESSD